MGCIIAPCQVLLRVPESRGSRQAGTRRSENPDGAVVNPCVTMPHQQDGGSEMISVSC